MSNHSYISALDHVVVNVPDIELAISHSETLFGKPPLCSGQSEGLNAGLFQFANTGLLFRETETDFGLVELCFQVPNAARFQRRLQAVGPKMQDHSRADPYRELAVTSAMEDVYTLAPEETRSLRLSFIERPTDWSVPTEAAKNPGRVMAMDHLVIRTQNVDAVMALFAARLGLSLRLDLNRPDWGAQLLFFRCGDMILEVARGLNEDEQGLDADYFWGVSWRVANAAEAAADLAALGVDVSKSRKGRRAGTEVFTVRDHNCDVPTIMLQTPNDRR